MLPFFYSKLTPLYQTYNGVIKPLIAEIEVRFEQFPTSIYNEIRAFNDHIARCYYDINNQDLIETQVRKATGHIERIVLDCYKYLNVKLYDLVIKDFDKKTKNIDLTTINNGEFYPQYKSLQQFIVTNLKKAKLLETQENKEESIVLYEIVHNKYVELEDLITQNHTHIKWARAKYYSKKVINFLGWLIAAVISGIISSSIIPWDKIWEYIKSLFI